MYKQYGYVRVGACVPKLKVANVEDNVLELIQNTDEADDKNINVLVTPELSMTGYTCADLFHNDTLLDDSLEGLRKILVATKNKDMLIAIGMPIRHENQLFNTAVMIQGGRILGIIPKSYIPNYQEFYEKRWFSSGNNIKNHTINILDQSVPIDTNIIFRDKEDKDIAVGIEICEDLWIVNPPSNSHAINGATILLNLSASNEVIGKYEYRKSIVQNQAAKTISAYAYVSSGVGESTTDLVFSGHSLICEEGRILKENERFSMNGNLIYADVDIKRIMNDRRRNSSYMGYVDDTIYTYVDIDIRDKIERLDRKYSRYPFVPKNDDVKDKRCREIFTIQACGLAKRLHHTGIDKTVIGISGGLDSTLAFLVILEAYRMLGIDNKNIIAVTMPGFGTTGRTYNNAVSLVKEYGATLREVDIRESCLGHFKDIGLDANNHNITYENAQARERTQILMDIANLEGGLVIGTGDLSELSLGWCTYNGDHMSMYAVNTSIPKTLVRDLVRWVGNREEMSKKQVILDIVDTPISPELLPPSKDGNIQQMTEDTVGPYILHDFFLYHMLRYGASIDKIYLLAKDTFEGMYDREEIKKWLEVFIRRFFSQQFKRSCLPDGPKVGTISLSPRGDLRMPSDADVSGWLRKVKKL